MAATAQLASTNLLKPPEFAKHWAQELCTSTETLVQLRGGINNRVFRCGSHKRHWIIKGYPTHPDEQQSRMEAEVDFLRYARVVASSRVPELIAVDKDRHCVVMEYIFGNVYADGSSLNREDIEAARIFFNDLNFNMETARLMIKLDASDGFLRLSQHMANVLERIAAMGTDHLPLECKEEAAEKLGKLREQASRVEAKLEMQIALGEVEDNLDPNLRCVSPSDFGFHNAIKTPQGVKFIDFEFAGWDDPAKAAADFLLQPRVPVPNKLSLSFSGWLQEQTHEIQARLNAIKPILRLKWACIILGMLKPERLDSMLQVNQGIDLQKLVNHRLASCNLYLEKA